MQFDATLKTLLEAGPADWPRLLGRPATDVEVIDADASTVTGAADKVLRVNGPDPYILHLEFQTGPDAGKPLRLNLYNAVLEDRAGLPVQTVLVLLRPSAFLRAYDGQYRRARAAGWSRTGRSGMMWCACGSYRRSACSPGSGRCPWPRSGRWTTRPCRTCSGT